MANVATVTPSKKRERSKNYLEDEKENLLEIVEKYHNIIENKKTDGVSANQKHVTWDKIAEEYNSTAKTGIRNGVQLKLLYDNLKKTAKKHKADDKIEIYTTGGDNSNTKSSNLDTKVLCLLGSQVEGHKNPYDSNANFNNTIADTNTLNFSDVYTEVEVAELNQTQVTVAEAEMVVSETPVNTVVVREAAEEQSSAKKNNIVQSQSSMTKNQKQIKNYDKEIFRFKKERHEKKMEILEICKQKEQCELDIKILELKKAKCNIYL